MGRLAGAGAPDPQGINYLVEGHSVYFVLGGDIIVSTEEGPVEAGSALLHNKLKIYQTSELCWTRINHQEKEV